MPLACANLAVPRNGKEEKEEAFRCTDAGVSAKPAFVQAHFTTGWINSAGALGLMVVAAIFVLSLYFIAKYLL